MASSHNQLNLIEETSSLCPHCLKTIPAEIYNNAGHVYMYKICPQHGEFDIYIWPDADHYQWMKGFNFHPVRHTAQTDSIAGCPRDCGLCPKHRRHSTIAEIEVTWRCNLACPVCFVATGKVHPDPTLPIITDIFNSIRDLEGVNVGIQITGGEPTMRSDLADIIAIGRKVGFTGIEMNTNGLVIASDRAYLRALKEAGLSSIYLQFDDLTAKVSRALRGEDLLACKLRAIENCRLENVPVALAVTVIDGVNDDGIGRLINFAMSNLDVIHGISLQAGFMSGRFEVAQPKRLSAGDIAFLVASQSDGHIIASDLWPLGCSHPLCSCATYLLSEKNSYKPISRVIGKQAYQTCYDINSPQGSVFPDMLGKLEIGAGPSRGLSLLIMGLMDAWTIDLNRARECSITIYSPEGYAIPFCVYHLTNIDGKRLYPLGCKRSAPVYCP